MKLTIRKIDEFQFLPPNYSIIDREEEETYTLCLRVWEYGDSHRTQIGEYSCLKDLVVAARKHQGNEMGLQRTLEKLKPFESSPKTVVEQKVNEKNAIFNDEHNDPYEVRIEKIGFNSNGHLCSFTWHPSSRRPGKPLTQRSGGRKTDNGSFRVALSVFDENGKELLPPFREFADAKAAADVYGKLLDETTVRVGRADWTHMAIQIVEYHD